MKLSLVEIIMFSSVIGYSWYFANDRQMFVIAVLLGACFGASLVLHWATCTLDAANEYVEHLEEHCRKLRGELHGFEHRRKSG